MLPFSLYPGFIYDYTNFYPASFYFGGGCICLSALILVPVFLRCCKFENKEENNEMSGSLQDMAEHEAGDNLRLSVVKRCEKLDKEDSLTSDHSEKENLSAEVV